MGYTTLLPSFFLKRYKNAVGVCDRRQGQETGWEGAINASNARAHERPQGSSRFQNARVYTYMHWAARVQGSDCYMSTAGIVIATPAANPAFLPSRVCTCVPAIWNCTHLHAHEWADELVNERASERASEQTSHMRYSRDVDISIVDVFLQPQAIWWPIDVTQ